MGWIKDYWDKRISSPKLTLDDGCTALIYTVGKGDEVMVRLLITCVGLDINIEPPEGRTALMWAIKGRRQDRVSILLSHTEVDVKLESSAGETPLVVAASENDELIVKLLLSNPKIDVDCQSRDCMTALANCHMLWLQAH